MRKLLTVQLSLTICLISSAPFSEIPYIVFYVKCIVNRQRKVETVKMRAQR
jgi:hypothetical protein